LIYQACDEAEKLCNGALVQGPCTREINGACKSHEKITRRIRNYHLGVVRWITETVNGACREYDKHCEEYEQVCKDGFKKTCRNLVRPFDDVKNELTWLVYQEYMSQLGDEYPGSISTYYISRIQDFYKTPLGSIRISKGQASLGDGITDCTHIRTPDLQLLQSIQQGTKPTKDDLTWLLHELRHSDQCAKVGGRKAYASMWFRQFEGTMMKRWAEWSAKANLLAPLLPGDHSTALVAVIVNDLKNDGATRIHDAMPMEADAEDYSGSIIDRAYARF